jgi:hypothetical protein
VRLLVFLWLAAASAASAATPGPGRYDAQLCVATQAGAAPSCGAVDVEVKSRGRVGVRVADIVYRLTLRSSQLDVTTSQGTMQIDQFSSPYDWAGDTLRFADTAKDVHYEVRLGARKAAGH